MDCYTGAGRAAPAVQAGAGPLQGLHRHPQGQRLPVAAHHAGQPAGHGGRVPDPHRADARGGREGIARTGCTRPGRARRQRQDAQRLGAIWLQSLLDIQDETRDAAEFSSTSRSTCFPDAVYVFTPRQSRSWRCRAAPRRWTSPTPSTADVGDHGGGQGQRRAGGAAHRAAQWRRGGDHHRAGVAPQPARLQLRAHRALRARRSAATSRRLEQEESHAADGRGRSMCCCAVSPRNGRAARRRKRLGHTPADPGDGVVGKRLLHN